VETPLVMGMLFRLIVAGPGVGYPFIAGVTADIIMVIPFTTAVRAQPLA
jgi:hypothetical protein